MKTSQYVREVLLYTGIDGIVNETTHTMRALSHTKNFIPRIRTSAVLTTASLYKAATDSICFRLMFSQLCDVHEIYENYSLTKICSFTLSRFGLWVRSNDSDNRRLHTSKAVCSLHTQKRVNSVGEKKQLRKVRKKRPRANLEHMIAVPSQSKNHILGNI